MIPKEHIPSVAGVTSENSAIIAKCFEGIAEGGYRIISNCGPNARQTVPHLHFHVLGGTRLPDKMC